MIKMTHVLWHVQSLWNEQESKETALTLTQKQRKGVGYCMALKPYRKYKQNS